MLSTKLTQYFCFLVVILSSIVVQADAAAQEAIQFSGSIVIDIQGGSSRRRSEMSQELQELVNATSFIPKIQFSVGGGKPRVEVVLRLSDQAELQEVSQLVEEVDSWANKYGLVFTSKSLSPDSMNSQIFRTTAYCEVDISLGGINNAAKTNRLFLDLVRRSFGQPADLKLRLVDANKETVTTTIASDSSTPYKNVATVMAIVESWVKENKLSNSRFSISVKPDPEVVVDGAGEVTNISDLENLLEQQEELTKRISEDGQHNHEKVRREVAWAFELKQKILKAQIEQIKSKLSALEERWEERASNGDKIVDRRVAVLLNKKSPVQSEDYRGELWPTFKELPSEAKTKKLGHYFEDKVERESTEIKRLLRVYKIPAPIDAEQLAAVLRTMIPKLPKSNAFRCSADDGNIQLYGGEHAHRIAEDLIDAMIELKESQSTRVAELELDRVLTVYAIDKTKCVPCYQLLSEVLKGKEGVRLAVDEEAGRMLVYGSAGVHRIVKETLGKFLDKKIK